ncbi:YgjP-like metallopeptidase domain-containing protein [Motiliproteus sp. MSK22-1]|uniref:YgjP-like metallopeptidase domain-containing protein n=1 Tax=Motiliproteus sp. MSK22-1 TaxID=1897630 RepID=UPI00097742BA|nr:M48 family metallopeptidase [Motiliproteus sp. MSK22-1]OMH39099.1 metal-dependent hydrolase [Motiliproteus sp. MSK22-1]
MTDFKYLSGYPEQTLEQVQALINSGKLVDLLLQRYPSTHDLKANRSLYDYVNGVKSEYLRKSAPLSKVVYDDKIHVIKNALGTHSYVSRVQGAKLKSKNEIRIASVFKEAPLEFLRMIVVHELAHLKEKSHNKAFYKLCQYMEPSYHQLEFDLRLYLTCKELIGPIY